MVLVIQKRSGWEPFAQALSQGLQSLGQMYSTQKFLKQQQSKNARALELLGGLPEDQAEAFSGMSPYLQQLWMNRNRMYASNPNKSLSSLMNNKQQSFQQKEPQMPIKRAASTARKKLTSKIIDTFLMHTNNDPKKARALAKKYGYEV